MGIVYIISFLFGVVEFLPLKTRFWHIIKTGLFHLYVFVTAILNTGAAYLLWHFLPGVPLGTIVLFAVIAGVAILANVTLTIGGQSIQVMPVVDLVENLKSSVRDAISMTAARANRTQSLRKARQAVPIYRGRVGDLRAELAIALVRNKLVTKEQEAEHEVDQLIQEVTKIIENNPNEDILIRELFCELYQIDPALANDILKSQQGQTQSAQQVQDTVEQDQTTA